MLVDSLIFIQPTFSVHKLVPNELFVPTGGHFSFICDYSKNRTVTPATPWPHTLSNADINSQFSLGFILEKHPVFSQIRILVICRYSSFPSIVWPEGSLLDLHL